VITLKTAEDWQRLRDEGLNIVLDPMIFRAAELFLAGVTHQSGETWATLSANLSGLASFFDAIVLHERLPIFDYDITFPEAAEVGAGASYRLVPLVNAEKNVLTPIHVTSAAYTPLKQAALEELRAQPVMEADERASVLGELTVFDYRWTPFLDGFDAAPEDERRLATFLYGALLFSAYAQELRGTHQRLSRPLLTSRSCRASCRIFFKMRPTSRARCSRRRLSFAAILMSSLIGNGATGC
jgi:hypothetical protein